MNAALRSDRQILECFDPFEGDKEGPDVEFPPRVVRTRKVHTCRARIGHHEIPVGSRAVVYAWIDGSKVRQLHCCDACIDAWLTRCRLEPDLEPSRGAS